MILKFLHTGTIKRAKNQIFCFFYLCQTVCSYSAERNYYYLTQLSEVKEVKEVREVKGH